MSTYALAICVPRASTATVVNSIQVKWIPVAYEIRCQPPAPCQRWPNIGNANIFSCSLQYINSSIPSDKCACIILFEHHWLKQWLVDYLVSSLYLYHCWLLVSWNFSNISHSNMNQNAMIFIQGNVFENIICRMVAILSLPQCAKQVPVVWNDSSRVLKCVY